MERWDVGCNGYFGSASIEYSSGPAWSFWIPSILDLIHHIFCRIPIPGFILRRKVVDDGEVYSFEEWYGDRLCGPLSHWENTVFQWCWSHQRHASIPLSMKTAYLALKPVAPQHVKGWEEEWDRGTESWEENGPPNPVRANVYRKRANESLWAGPVPKRVM